MAHGPLVQRESPVSLFPVSICNLGYWNIMMVGTVVASLQALSLCPCDRYAGLLLLSALLILLFLLSFLCRLFLLFVLLLLATVVVVVLLVGYTTRSGEEEEEASCQAPLLQHSPARLLSSCFWDGVSAKPFLASLVVLQRSPASSSPRPLTQTISCNPPLR